MRLVMPNPLTHETFAEFVRTHRFGVIHFWAAWNGVDHVMHRLLETQIPADLREQVTFSSLDVDPLAHRELCLQHKIANVPFLALYRDSVLTRSVTGMRTPEVITDYLRELVNEAVAQPLHTTPVGTFSAASRAAVFRRGSA